MTERMEFVGRNLKKAVQKACETLQTTPEALEYDIISHGSTGIFGFGAIRKARISVTTPVESTVREEFPADHRAGERDGEPYSDAPKPAARAEENPVEQFDAVLDNAYERMANGEKVLRRIIDALSPESTIHIERNGTCIKFQINGGNAGIMIGKRGQTLEAIQTLIEKTVNRTGGERIHIGVDVEKYLVNRRAGLVRTAKQFAEKVKVSGRPVTMGYMNAQDRRTVHLALKDEDDILTQSAGEGYLRKLKIYPKRRSKGRPY